MVSCVQYRYECSCGWKKELARFLVPGLDRMICPDCKAKGREVLLKAIPKEAPYPARA
jgi:hypothetical protein